MWKKFLLTALSVVAVCGVAAAQEVDVDHYTINAQIDTTANKLSAQAVLALSNPSDTSKPRIYLRITKKAKVSQVTIDGGQAQYEVSDDFRFNGLYQITVTPVNPLPPGGHSTIGVTYTLDASETTPLLAIYPGEVLLMPESVWFPAPSNMFAIYGPNTAPYNLNVQVTGGNSDFKAASAGVASGGFSFDSKLNSLPFVVGGDFAPPTTSDHGGVKIELYVQPGLTSSSGGGEESGSGGAGRGGQASESNPTGGSAAEQAARIQQEAGRVVDFMSRLFGPAPTGTVFRIISSVNAGNFSVPGALVLNEQVFRQDVLDATTIELLADAVARIWIDGRVRVRGIDARSGDVDHPARRARSDALLRDSIPRYLAALYIQDRFGADAGQQVFARMRASYQPVAKSHRDTEFAVETLLNGTYSDAAYSKGPLILRLIAHTVGQDKLMEAVSKVFNGALTKIETIEDLKASLPQSAALDKIFKDWIDTITEPDLIIGLPLPTATPGVQQIALRNLGTGDIPTSVLAITASGKQITAPVTVPSQDLTSAEIPTGEKIVSVEVDPEKYYLQTNYDNDFKEVDTKTFRVTAATLLNEGIVAFNQGKYGDAEERLRRAAKSDPHDSLPLAWLARTLYAEKKLDEALAQAQAAVKIDPPLTSALSWAHITMGMVELEQGHAADAITNLRRGVTEAVEEPAQYAGRDALINAEKSAGKQPAVDPAVRTLVSELDGAVKQPASDRLFGLVMKSNLKKFVDGLTLSPPQSWSTEILNADRIDANRVALDVKLNVVQSGGDHSGTALYLLHRVGGKWMLENIRLFRVK